MLSATSSLRPQGRRESTARRRASGRRSPRLPRSARFAPARARARARHGLVDRRRSRFRTRRVPAAPATRRACRRSRRRRRSSPLRARSPRRACRCGTRSPRRRAAPRLEAQSAREPLRRLPQSSASPPRDRSGATRTAAARRQNDRVAGPCWSRCRARRAGWLRRGRAEASRARVRQARAPNGRAAPPARPLAGLVEAFARVHANRLQQTITAPAPASPDGDERLLREAREEVGDFREVETVAGADLLGRLELEAAGEDREPAEEHPLVRLEEIVAPLERRAQRLLARRAARLPARRRRNRSSSRSAIARRAEGPDPAGRELERKRQAVEAKADSRDVVRVLIVEREPRRGGCAARRRAARPRTREAQWAGAPAPGRECPATERGTRPRRARAAARGSSPRS